MGVCIHICVLYIHICRVKYSIVGQFSGNNQTFVCALHMYVLYYVRTYIYAQPPTQNHGAKETEKTEAENVTIR